MRVLRQFFWISVFSLAGEAMHRLLPLPVPAAVYGLVLLFLALESGLLPLSAVQETGQFLLSLMPLLFVSPVVNLMDSWPQLAASWLPVLGILAISTLLVFSVSGLVTQRLLLREPEAEEQQEAKYE